MKFLTTTKETHPTQGSVSHDLLLTLTSSPLHLPAKFYYHPLLALQKSEGKSCSIHYIIFSSKREIRYSNTSGDLKILSMMSCNCSRLRKILEGKTEEMRIALPQEENAPVIKKMKGHYEKDKQSIFYAHST